MARPMSPRFCIDANGDGEVVDHAETFAVLGKGVMKATADVDADAVLERAFRRQNRAAGVEHEGVDHLRRIGNLHLQFFARAQAAFHQLVDVEWRVHQQDIGFAGGLGNDEVALVSHVLLKKQLANQAIFVGAKDVLADGQEILLAINQFEGQHGADFQARQLTPES